MKYVLFVGLSLLFGATGCSSNNDASVGNRTTMEVEKEIDAGEVVKGEFITAKIKVKNTGDYPLIISDVKTSCSCTVADKPEEPIAPGKTGKIVAQIDTDKTGAGGVTKVVNIISNSQEPVTAVKIKATVLRN